MTINADTSEVSYLTLANGNVNQFVELEKATLKKHHPGLAATRQKKFAG